MERITGAGYKDIGGLCMNIKTLKLIDGLLEENEAAAMERCLKEADELEACRKEHPDDQGTDGQKKRACKAFEELIEAQDARKDFIEEQWHGGLH